MTTCEFSGPAGGKGPPLRRGATAGTLAGCLLLFVLAGQALFAAALPASGELPAGGFGGSIFGRELVDHLAAEGLERARMERIFADGRAAILRRTLAYAVVYKETKADYSHFLDPDRLARARSFLERKSGILLEAEQRFGVPKEVAAAILMIESDFGNFRKLHRTVNVFATLVWAGRPENFEALKEIVRQRIPDADDERIRRRADKKARWGFNQLVTLLRIFEREKQDPYDLEGSWAGAFGLPQFIPTSYWDYAVDGNGDRRIDLFNEDDAVFSIGNYLSRFGWKAGLSTEKKKAVLRRYNNSSLYVDTVLEAADRLSGT